MEPFLFLTWIIDVLRIVSYLTGCVLVTLVPKDGGFSKRTKEDNAV